MMDSLSYFSFQPVLHDGVTKVMVCAVLSGVVYIKEPLLLIGKSSPSGGSVLPRLLSEWAFTICLTPYNHK